jgi:hypothetical protein
MCSTTGEQAVAIGGSEAPVPQPLSKLVAISRTASRRIQHAALGIMGLLHGLKAFRHPSGVFAESSEGGREQQGGEDDGALAQCSALPRAGGDSTEQGGDHRCPRRQGSPCGRDVEGLIDADQPASRLVLAPKIASTGFGPHAQMT